MVTVRPASCSQALKNTFVCGSFGVCVHVSSALVQACRTPKCQQKLKQRVHIVVSIKIAFSFLVCQHQRSGATAARTTPAAAPNNGTVAMTMPASRSAREVQPRWRQGSVWSRVLLRLCSHCCRWDDVPPVPEVFRLRVQSPGTDVSSGGVTHTFPLIPRAHLSQQVVCLILGLGAIFSWCVCVCGGGGGGCVFFFCFREMR